MNTLRRASTAALALMALGLSAGAQAGAVITYGNTSLGVNDAGHLNFGGLGPGGFMTYGVFRAGVGDAISPGCFCEGWGVAVTPAGGSRTSGFVNESAGNGGLTGGTFGSTASTATSNIGLAGAPVSVTHQYGPSLAADLFQVQVTITNNGSVPMHDLVYRRAMDWDVPPTEFSEFVTHSGVASNLVGNGGNVLFASDNGFANSDPLIDAGALDPATLNVDFTDNGPSDHGSVFDFAFGTLDPGASRIFNIFYGSAGSEGAALGQIAAVGADLYSLGQNSGPDGATSGTPATFVFAFGGVGGSEPGSTPDNPILPFVPAPGVFEFPAPTPRRWYDPPLVDTFRYDLLGGGTFTEVGAPPGFADMCIRGADGVTVLACDFDGGETFLFGPGVTTFFITDISPIVDAGDPTAFPTFLDFTGTGPDTVLRMTGIVTAVALSEPGSMALILIPLAATLLSRRRKVS